MIGARLSPHRAHTTAVLVRVVAALVTLAGVVVIPYALLDAVLGHVSAPAALVHVALAAALMVVAFVVVRRLDPLR